MPSVTSFSSSRVMQGSIGNILGASSVAVQLRAACPRDNSTPPSLLPSPPHPRRHVPSDIVSAFCAHCRRRIQGSVAIWLVARQVESLNRGIPVWECLLVGSQQHLYPHDCSLLPPTSLTCSCAPADERVRLRIQFSAQGPRPVSHHRPNVRELKAGPETQRTQGSCCTCSTRTQLSNKGP